MATVTKSIGTTARDYTTMTLWEADLDDTGIYSSGDDAVGECYNDSVFDETFTVDGGSTVGLASIRLSVASGERHDGTAGNGARIVRTAARVEVALESSVNTTMEWIEVDANGNGDGSGFINRATNDTTIQRCILHGVERNGNVPGVSLGTENGAAYIHNTIIYDFLCTESGTNYAYGIRADNTGGGDVHQIHNVTIYGITNNNGSGPAYGVLNIDNVSKTYKNVVIAGTGGTSSGTIQDWAVSTDNNADCATNASDDSTAPGAFAGEPIVAGTEFTSVAGGSEDFHLKTGAESIDAGTDIGTTPTGVNFDIDSRDRDAEGDTWDMGADEFVAEGEPLPPSITSGPGGMLPLMGVG